MRTWRMMVAFSSIALIGFCEPALSQPTPQARPKTAPQATQAKNKSLTHRAQRENNANRLRSTAIAEPPKAPLSGWPALVREARKYMGTNPTARDRLWCATFMNMVLAKVGYSGTNSDAARSFAQYGRRINEPRIGAIAVLTRGKNGGHVGVVSGIDPSGNPIIISGNHGRKVGEAIYPRSRVIAYVMPSERQGSTQYAERSAPQRGNDSELDSPIAELLAVIESEYNAKGRPRGTGPEPRPLPPSQARRDVPLDPALAEFLGLKERAAPSPQISRMPVVQPPTAPVQQRELRVEQRAPGRVASNGLTVAR
ncbi:TIGR02594 family protein [Undibacter mobilis]|uniref:TIGR02594 family protein n=1 Tax=Undibacter mobilis TaxID=2292256 RepID=A0A371B7E6_9BRAD|nr:TIGR02594 family protein [Undibacter mobilis]